MSNLWSAHSACAFCRLFFCCCRLCFCAVHPVFSSRPPYHQPPTDHCLPVRVIRNRFSPAEEMLMWLLHVCVFIGRQRCQWGALKYKGTVAVCISQSTKLQVFHSDSIASECRQPGPPPFWTSFGPAPFIWNMITSLAFWLGRILGNSFWSTRTKRQVLNLLEGSPQIICHPSGESSMKMAVFCTIRLNTWKTYQISNERTHLHREQREGNDSTSKSEQPVMESNW